MCRIKSFNQIQFFLRLYIGRLYCDLTSQNSKCDAAIDLPACALCDTCIVDFAFPLPGIIENEVGAVVA